MSAMDHPSLLEQLIITGELVIQMRSARTPETVGLLRDEVAAEYARPCDGLRVIGLDTLIFAEALVGATPALRGIRRDEATKFVRVVGVLLPEIRYALTAAIELRKRPSA